MVISHQAASKKNPQTKRLEPTKKKKKKISDYRHPVPQQFPLHTFQVDGDPHFFLVLMGRRRLWIRSLKLVIALSKKKRRRRRKKKRSRQQAKWKGAICHLMARPIPLFVGDQLHVWKKEGKRRPPVSPWTNISVVFFTRKRKIQVTCRGRQQTTDNKWRPSHRLPLGSAICSFPSPAAAYLPAPASFDFN